MWLVVTLGSWSLGLSIGSFLGPKRHRRPWWADSSFSAEPVSLPHSKACGNIWQYLWWLISPLTLLFPAYRQVSCDSYKWCCWYRVRSHPSPFHANSAHCQGWIHSRMVRERPLETERVFLFRIMLVFRSCSRFVGCVVLTFCYDPRYTSHV